MLNTELTFSTFATILKLLLFSALKGALILGVLDNCKLGDFLKSLDALGFFHDVNVLFIFSIL